MNETSNSPKKVDPLLILGVIAIVAVVGYILLQSRTGYVQPTDRMTQVDESDGMQEEEGAVEDTILDTEIDDAEGISEITVEGGDFFFRPNEIRVKQGEKVKIRFNNTGGFHDFVIEEFNVKTKQFNGPDTVEVEFTPDQVGEFEFYCSVGQHRANGMTGMLIVEE